MKNSLILLFCLSLFCLRIIAQNPDCNPGRPHCVILNNYHKKESKNKITYHGEIDMSKQSGGDHVRGIEMCFPKFSSIDTIIAIRLYSTTNPHVKFKIFHSDVNQDIYPGKTQVAIYAQNIESGVPVDDCIVIKYKVIVNK